MKKTYTLLLFLFSAVSILAQAPEKMSYQAVLRDASNTLLTNQEVGMQISILQSTATGTAVYTETQTATTNINGLVSIAIGYGTSSSNFSAIDWSAGPYFIKTTTDPSGGSSYSITGTSQLMSVPFAMYAKTSGSSETNATNISENTSDIATNVKAITANTVKVGYTEASVSANKDVAANTLKVGYTEALVSANKDVAANTLKVGYTEALVSANTDVAANTLKVGYTEALVSANTDVVENRTNTAILNDLIVALEARIAVFEPAKVGDSRAGGVVFWVDPTDNTHGLVCAFQDYANTVEWGCDDTDLPNVSNVPWNGGVPIGLGAEIGDGVSNTNAILTDCSTAPAALAARSLGADWFLPSIKELNEMYINKTTLEAVSGFAAFADDDYYWSSTEGANNTAWRQYFYDGNQENLNKYFTYYVRAVRAF
jgi:hypothetical protein